ncbi:MAG: hypothetical protein ABW149_15295 [Sedimenticola sp.]
MNQSPKEKRKEIKKWIVKVLIQEGLHSFIAVSILVLLLLVTTELLEFFFVDPYPSYAKYIFLATYTFEYFLWAVVTMMFLLGDEQKVYEHNIELGINGDDISLPIFDLLKLPVIVLTVLLFPAILVIVLLVTIRAR